MSDFGFPDVPPTGRQESAEFVVGYSTAETLHTENPGRTDWVNPFREGTDQHRGFEEAVRFFAQK